MTALLPGNWLCRPRLSTDTKAAEIGGLGLARLQQQDFRRGHGRMLRLLSPTLELLQVVSHAIGAIS